VNENVELKPVRTRRRLLLGLTAWCVCGPGVGISPAQIAREDGRAEGADRETVMSEQLPAIRQVKTDRDGVVRVNAQPFVPIFAWWVYPEQLDELAQTGVNVALSPRANPAYAQAAMRLGMYVGANPRPDLAGNAALLFWMQEDEPDIRIQGGPRLASADDARTDQARDAVDTKTLIDRVMPVLKERRKYCLRCDPHRPVFLNFSYLLMPRFWGTEQGSRRLYTAMGRGGDVLSWDIYPIGVFGRPEWLGLVYLGTRRLHSFATDKPVMAFLECTRVHANPAARQPTGKEMRNEAWQAIIAGGTGLGWFTYGTDLSDHSVKRKNSFAVSPENRRALRRINDEIKRQTSAVVARELAGGLRMGQDELPEVAFSLRRNARRVYLLAVNMRYDRQAISWEALTTWSDADEETVQQARSQLPVEAWSELAPLEVRILQVDTP